MKQEDHLNKIFREKLEGLNFDYNPVHWEMMQERMRMEGMDVEPNAFDEAMKGKLENIAPTFNPLHWEMMQDAIAAEGLTDLDADVDPIDELIKSRLENITPELNPVHWEMMKDAMGAEGMNVELDPVDELLKNKLENIDHAYNPAHWEILKERIDAADLADAKQVDEVLFDAATYGQLSNIEFPYNEEHWQLMKERIDAEFSIRGRMMRYKVAEVALILMIIITAFHYLPIHKKKMQQKNIVAAASVIDKTDTSTYEQIAPAEMKTTTEALIDANTIVSSNSNKKETTTTAHNTNLLNAGNKNINIAIASNEVVVTKNKSTLTNNVDNDVDNQPTIITNQNDIVLAPPTKFINAPIIKTEASISNGISSAIAESILSKAAVETKNSITAATTEVEAVKTLQASLIDHDHNQEENAIGCSTCTELKQKWEISVGMFSAFDLNHVMTPYDNVFETGAYAQNDYGYGAGFSIGFKYNRWEVETGAIYNYKQYAPKPRIEIFSGNLASGYLGESINDVELNMVTIPLNLKYHFYQKGKWNLYANGGANLNMALQANYDKKQYFFSGSNAIGGTFTSPVNGALVARSETNSKKRFADGILEGGGFLENRYFTANLGIGVERKFNPRWSIFGQPTYQHQLLSQGLGPNKDRINTLSILTGARVTF